MYHAKLIWLDRDTRWRTYSRIFFFSQIVAKSFFYYSFVRHGINGWWRCSCSREPVVVSALLLAAEANIFRILSNKLTAIVVTPLYIERKLIIESRDLLL